MARSLPESLICKGSGNTKRMRDDILKKNTKESTSEHKLRNKIAKKVRDEINPKFEGDYDGQMSQNGGSRWYRAPEIALLQPKYD